LDLVARLNGSSAFKYYGCPHHTEYDALAVPDMPVIAAVIGTMSGFLRGIRTLEVSLVQQLPNWATPKHRQRDLAAKECS
jgi:hypothetical protein